MWVGLVMDPVCVTTGPQNVVADIVEQEWERSAMSCDGL
jgi:hypothetical protein